MRACYDAVLQKRVEKEQNLKETLDVAAVVVEEEDAAFSSLDTDDVFSMMACPVLLTPEAAGMDKQCQPRLQYQT